MEDWRLYKKLVKTYYYQIYFEYWEASVWVNQPIRSLRIQKLRVEKNNIFTIFGYNKKPSFGEVIFDITKENPTATYTAYSIDNEDVGSVQIGLKELQYK